MGEVLDFPTAGEPMLLDGLRRDLAERGSASAVIADLRVSVDLWRKTARAAARSLGRPVETIEAEATVHAVLRDWPSTPDEEARHRAAMRAAVNAASTPSGRGRR